METLRYKRLDGVWFILTDDFRFPFTLRSIYQNDPKLDEMVSLSGVLPDDPLYITAPQGFVTDLASIPKFLQPVLKPDGPWAAAACLHDLLYQKQPSIYSYPLDSVARLSAVTDKHFADLLFLRVMEASGVSHVLARSFYDAVKDFGQSSYNDDNSNCHYTEPTPYTFQYTKNYLFFREGIEVAVPLPDRIQLNSQAIANAKYANVKRAFLTDPHTLSEAPQASQQVTAA